MAHDIPIDSISRRNVAAMTGAAGLALAAGTGSALMSGLTVAHSPEPDLATPESEALSKSLLADFTMLKSAANYVVRPGMQIVLNNEHRTFGCIASMRDAATGARCFAFRETTSPGDNLTLLFPGRPSGGTPEDDATALDIIQGKRSSQSAATADFIRGQVLPYLAEHPGMPVNIFGHSMGAGNALMAKHIVSQLSPDVRATLYEPFAATLEARHIVQDAVTDGTASAQNAIGTLRRNVFTIRANPRTLVSKLRIGQDITGNHQFGEKAFVLDASRIASVPLLVPADRPVDGAVVGTAIAGALLLRRANENRPFSRRTFLKAAGTLAVPFASTASGMALREMFDEASHKIDPCIPVLEKGGNSVVPDKATNALASDEELMHPERYRMSMVDSVGQIAAETFMRSAGRS